eukprot:5691326-Amphidinium_carterae.1
MPSDQHKASAQEKEAVQWRRHEICPSLAPCGTLQSRKLAHLFKSRAARRQHSHQGFHLKICARELRFATWQRLKALRTEPNCKVPAAMPSASLAAALAE